MILPDWILMREKVCSPLEEAIKRDGKISYGCGSYGLDARVGYRFRVFSPVQSNEIDPKNFDERALIDIDLTPDGTDKPNYILIPPHSFALAETIEVFDIPRSTLCIVLGKSTYARCGLIVNCTPLEPEWRGKVTIELSNTTPLPLRVYCGEGICQCIFLRAEEMCKVSYADKKGRYQDQKGLTLPTVDKHSEYPEGK